MKLKEIVDEVVALIGRPDRIDDVMRAVRASITEVHSTAFYPRDRVEEAFDLAEPLHLIKLTLPARFKTFHLLGALSNGGTPLSLTTDNNQYTRVDPSAIFNSAIDYTTDVYYLAGAAFNIRSSVAVSHILAIYYTFPEVADSQLETWIMRDQPSLITELAISKCHTKFGRESLAKSVLGQWSQSMQLFVQQNLVEGLN